MKKNDIPEDISITDLVIYLLQEAKAGTYINSIGGAVKLYHLVTENKSLRQKNKALEMIASRRQPGSERKTEDFLSSIRDEIWLRLVNGETVTAVAMSLPHVDSSELYGWIKAGGLVASANGEKTKTSIKNSSSSWSNDSLTLLKNQVSNREPQKVIGAMLGVGQIVIQRKMKELELTKKKKS